MTFLNNLFLIALSAVSIPLIIHFLSKRRIKTIEFSSLRFLEQMQKSRMRWLKIKELILLLMRMAIIALIVMAFARPTLKGFAGASRASSAVAIVLDRSASMDTEGKTGSLFEEAKRLIARLVDTFQPGDQVTFITYPGDGSLNAFGPASPGQALKEKQSGAEQGYETGNIGEALKLALENIRRSPDLNREIYIFSDLQRNNWSNLPPSVLNRDAWKNLHLFTISSEPTGEENVGITDVLLPSQLLVPGENFNIEAELTNFGGGRLENVLVGVVVDGERKAQTSVALLPNQPIRMRFSLKLDNPGDHGGYVEIDYDRFAQDNRRYFSLHIPEKVNLLVVSQSQEQAKFVRLALDRPEAGQIAYDGILSGDLLKGDLAKYDVILLQNLPNLDPSREAAITRFVNGGGGLFVTLGKSSDINYWSRFLQGLGGITPGPLAGRKGEYLTWNNFYYEHPIFSIYSPDSKDKARIPELNVFFYHDIRGGKMLGSSSTGVNLLVESAAKPVMVLGAGFDLESGDIPAHTFFIPLLVRSVEYLGSRSTDTGNNGIIGQPLAWKLPDNITGDLDLVSPTNSIENLQPSSGQAGAMVSITEYDQPGIYQLKQGEKRLGLIAFNIDTRESENSRISTGEISEILGVTAQVIPPDSDMKNIVLQARFGRELWKEFLLAALILLIAESLLGRTASPRAESK